MRPLIASALLALPLAACSAEVEDVAGMDTPAPVDQASVATLDADELAIYVESGHAILIDVRTPEEFADGHIAGALNMPVESFDPAAIPLDEYSETILYCRSGRRSAIAADMLSQHLGSEVRHLEGGILAWQDADFPLTAPTSAE